VRISLPLPNARSACDPHIRADSGVGVSQLNNSIGSLPQYSTSLHDNRAKRLSHSMRFAFALSTTIFAVALNYDQFSKFKRHAFLRKAHPHIHSELFWVVIGGRRISKTFAWFLADNLNRCLGIDTRTTKEEVAKRPTLELLEMMKSCSKGQILFRRGLGS